MLQNWWAFDGNFVCSQVTNSVDILRFCQWMCVTSSIPPPTDLHMYHFVPVRSDIIIGLCGSTVHILCTTCNELFVSTLPISHNRPLSLSHTYTLFFFSLIANLCKSYMFATFPILTSLIQSGMCMLSSLHEFVVWSSFLFSLSCVVFFFFRQIHSDISHK